MKFTDSPNHDRGVSPVIGVILMVAITVILAAVIASFVLGLGGQNSSKPTATFTAEYDDANSVLTLTHDGGTTLEAGQLSVVGGQNGSSAMDRYADTSEISSGNQIIVEANADDTVRVVWEAPNGDKTYTLREWKGPDA